MTTGIGADSYFVAQSRVGQKPMLAPRIAVSVENMSTLKDLGWKDLFRATNPASQAPDERITIALGRQSNDQPIPWWQGLVRVRMFLQLLRIRADKTSQVPAGNVKSLKFSLLKQDPLFQLQPKTGLIINKLRVLSNDDLNDLIPRIKKDTELDRLLKIPAESLTEDEESRLRELEDSWQNIFDAMQAVRPETWIKEKTQGTEASVVSDSESTKPSELENVVALLHSDKSLRKDVKAFLDDVIALQDHLELPLPDDIKQAVVEKGGLTKRRLGDSYQSALLALAGNRARHREGTRVSEQVEIVVNTFPNPELARRLMIRQSGLIWQNLGDRLFLPVRGESPRPVASDVIELLEKMWHLTQDIPPHNPLLAEQCQTMGQDIDQLGEALGSLRSGTLPEKKAFLLLDHLGKVLTDWQGFAKTVNQPSQKWQTVTNGPILDYKPVLAHVSSYGVRKLFNREANVLADDAKAYLTAIGA